MRIGFNTLRNHLSGQSPAITRGRPRQKKLIDQVKTPVGHDGCKDHAGLHTSPEGVASVEDNAGGIDGSKGHALLHASYEGHSPAITRGRPRQKKLIDKVKTHVGHGFASIEDISSGNDGRKDHAGLHTSLEGHSPTIPRGRTRQKKLIDKAKRPVGHDWIDPDSRFVARFDLEDASNERWQYLKDGKVLADGIYFDSPSDPAFIRMRNERISKLIEKLQLPPDPNGEGLYETLCRLRGRRPFYEDPRYENAPKVNYENQE